jgi:hypothetical protein
MDDVARAALVMALERLREDLTIRGASLPVDSPVRAAMEKTLADLRRKVETDPGWFDEILQDAAKLLGPPTDDVPPGN